MAKYGSNSVGFLLVDEYNILGVTTELSDKIEVGLEETHALGDAWRAHAPTGLRSGTLEQSGFYDDAANGVNDALAEQSQTSRIVSYGLEGNTIGKRFRGLSGAFAGEYERIASRGELHKANGIWTVSGTIDENGLILHDLSAETADGDTETTGQQDNAASSANGGAAYLHCTSITLGTATNLVVTFRDSSDDITYANLQAMTALTAAGSERIEVSGTVERYIAVSWAWTGGAGGGSTATFMAGFKRN